MRRSSVSVTLADVLLDALAFIELNAGVNLDERIAAKGMEYISTRIDELSPEERRLLRETTEQRAADEPDPKRAAFFREVPEMFLLEEVV
jgi:hypothetical protein